MVTFFRDLRFSAGLFNVARWQDSNWRRRAMVKFFSRVLVWHVKLNEIGYFKNATFAV